MKPQVVVDPDGAGERRETPAPLKHLMAACAFVGLALLWSFPLVLHLNTHLPGPGIGDNVDFLWNFWWARFARANHLPFFRTSFLFAPAGTSLVLHTHTALSALAGATVLRSLPLAAAQNVVILVGLFLNGFCAYLLCWRVTRDRASAVVGGVIFGGAPFIAAHLYGHFNFTMAWPIPLFALAVVETTRRWNWQWAALAGFVLGVTLYVDYYYVVFEAAFALCYLTVALWDFSIERRGPGRLTRILSPVLGILLLLDIILIVVIVRTGGFETVIAGVRVLARDPFNPLQFGWALLAWWYWLQTRPRLRAHRVHGVGAGTVFSVTLTTMFACAATAAPVLWELGLLMRSGQYVSPPYFWKSAPKGVDLATLFMGNPLNGAFGEVIAGLYRRFGIDVVESTGWLGVAPVVLAIWLVRRTIGRPSDMQAEQSGHGLRDSATVRRWIVVGVVFLVWSLGSHLRVFGINTGMPLPQVFFHYLPIVANARMPGRAIVLVYLALSVLGSLALARRGLWRNPRLYFAAATVLLIADFLPAPFPLVALDRPAIYQTLRGRSEQGAVCELPFGIRDGSGERGLFDDRILFYQTIHERRLVGGFLARLPPSLIDVYERDPLLAAFLRLSARSLPLNGGDALPDRLQAQNRLRTDGIAFLMLNRQTASARLIDYVEHVLPVQRVADEGDRSLYVVEP